MSKYIKGQSGNLNGRGKGTPNVTTKEARQILNRILFAELDNIQESLKNIRKKDDSKYIECLIKLLAFSLPRKTDVSSYDEPINSGFSEMTKAQIESEIAHLWNLNEP